jgi:dTDP-4-dehydrorhamnose 3,5-epimerase
MRHDVDTMKFTQCPLPGAYVIDCQPHEDERGSFARVFCAREFADHGLVTRFVQCNISMNHRAGTLRGMHYQADPHAEVKLVRCTRGAVYDVIIDLRPQSPTYQQHVGVELSADTGRALYIPQGFAHGFITLQDHSEVFYQMSEFYEPASGRGVRWNDPAFGIQWPLAVTMIQDRDNACPDYVPVAKPR